jgi:Amt family ammonium transporter
VGLTPNPNYGGTIPEQTFMIYQLMFAIITPALITGAFAERVKFSSMAVFLSLWSLVVYCPMAHMVWGVGGLLNVNGGRWPVLDFAGGTVVHITSGVAALVTALYLGKRAGYPQEDMPPHSMVLSFIGAALLWVGWFGFNAGSALNAGPLATSAFVNTQFAAAAGAIGWVVGVDQQRQTHRSGRHLRRGRRVWPPSPRPRAFVQPMSALASASLPASSAPSWSSGSRVLRLRRLARRLRRAWRGRNHGRAAHRPLRLRRHQRRLRQERRRQAPPTGAIDGNWRIRFSIRPSAWASDGPLAIVGTLALLLLVDKTMGLRVSADRRSCRP